MDVDVDYMWMWIMYDWIIGGCRSYVDMDYVWMWIKCGSNVDVDYTLVFSVFTFHSRRQLAEDIIRDYNWHLQNFADQMIQYY